MEITCDIVMYLVDVYTNGIASEDTANAVREHLKTCPDCRRHYDEYKKTLDNEKKNKYFVVEKSPDFCDDIILESVNKISKRLKVRRTIRNVTSVVAVIVSLTVLLKGVFGEDKK